MDVSRAPANRKTLERFEMATDAVYTDGSRERMSGTVVVPAVCPFCGGNLADGNGLIRATIAIVDGAVRMTCEQPRGCLR